MADVADLQLETASFLRRKPPAAPELLAAEKPQPRFTNFVPALENRALDLASDFMRIAGPAPGPEQLAAVLEAAKAAAQTEPVDLVQYALMVFITHHPGASVLPIPSLEVRSPEKATQSPQGPTLLAGTPDETVLNWFREDPLANEHHERWHVVYPGRGIPTPSGQRHTKPRQGELFLYMHQQMLARYDTERTAAGLELVKPFESYGEVVDFGYDPGPRLAEFYPARSAGKAWGDLDRPDLLTYSVAEQEGERDKLRTAVDAKNVFLNPDRLGATSEQTVDSLFNSSPAGLHNTGHLFFSVMDDPQGQTPPGVMIDTATAIRDPVFFRWHRHVDDFYFRWQETKDPNVFTDAPPVRIRKGPAGGAPANQSPDIIVALKERVPGAAAADFNGRAFGESTFGGDHWDTDPSSLDFVDDVLITEMLTRSYQYIDQPSGITFQQTIDYLDQKEFYYFLRLENPTAQKQDVTVRIFLAAQQLAGNRRMWIEMDKFRQTLNPEQRAVVFRRAADSSVVRKPNAKPPQFLPIRRNAESATSTSTYCDCGWPYNLLLPRGTEAGLGFRFLVMLTAWEIDRVSADSTCGSLSYCGSKQSYPDTRAMGYPFDRPFKDKSIADVIRDQPNMATRDMTIRTTAAP
ncbi:MAG: tyrosinase family protein [Thermoanaerobaculia bacterium]